MQLPQPTYANMCFAIVPLVLSLPKTSPAKTGIGALLILAIPQPDACTHLFFAMTMTLALMIIAIPKMDAITKDKREKDATIMTMMTTITIMTMMTTITIMEMTMETRKTLKKRKKPKK